MRSSSVIGALAAATVSLGARRVASDDPGAALERLKAGNGSFVENAASPLPVDAETRQALTKGQSPYAIVLTCADSRVPPEIIFNAGLGELFVVRSAGEVTDKAVLGEHGIRSRTPAHRAHRRHGPRVVRRREGGGETKPGAPSMGPNLDYLVKSSSRPSIA